MVYLLSSRVVPVALDGPHTVAVRPVTPEDARSILGEGFVSAVGHEGTAQVLSALLGIVVPPNRIAVEMRPGDEAVHLAITARLPEGRVLTAEELAGIPYQLVHSRVLA